MSDIIKKFNEISLDFIKQTEQITGTSYVTKFKMITAVNCATPINIYIENILEYKELIYNKDDDFFININFNNSYMNYFTDFPKMKKIFHTLDNATKEGIWDYMQALTYLAENRYNNKNLSI